MSVINYSYYRADSPFPVNPKDKPVLSHLRAFDGRDGLHYVQGQDHAALAETRLTCEEMAEDLEIWKKAQEDQRKAQA